MNTLVTQNIFQKQTMKIETFNTPKVNLMLEVYGLPSIFNPIVLKYYITKMLEN